MMYKIGDVLTSRDFMTGGTREYYVTKTTQKSVFFKCIRIDDLPISGVVQKTRLDENGELWTKNSVRLCKA